MDHYLETVRPRSRDKGSPSKRLDAFKSSLQHDMSVHPHAPSRNIEGRMDELRRQREQREGGKKLNEESPTTRSQEDLTREDAVQYTGTGTSASANTVGFENYSHLPQVDVASLPTLGVHSQVNTHPYYAQNHPHTQNHYQQQSPQYYPTHHTSSPSPSLDPSIQSPLLHSLHQGRQLAMSMLDEDGNVQKHQYSPNYDPVYAGSHAPMHNHAMHHPIQGQGYPQIHPYPVQIHPISSTHPAQHYQNHQSHQQEMSPAHHHFTYEHKSVGSYNPDDHNNQSDKPENHYSIHYHGEKPTIHPGDAPIEKHGVLWILHKGVKQRCLLVAKTTAFSGEATIFLLDAKGQPFRQSPIGTFVLGGKGNLWVTVADKSLALHEDKQASLLECADREESHEWADFLCASVLSNKPIIRGNQKPLMENDAVQDSINNTLEGDQQNDRLVEEVRNMRQFFSQKNKYEGESESDDRYENGVRPPSSSLERSFSSPRKLMQRGNSFDNTEPLENVADHSKLRYDGDEEDYPAIDITAAIQDLEDKIHMNKKSFERKMDEKEIELVRECKLQYKLDKKKIKGDIAALRKKLASQDGVEDTQRKEEDRKMKLWLEHKLAKLEKEAENRLLETEKEFHVFRDREEERLMKINHKLQAKIKVLMTRHDKLKRRQRLNNPEEDLKKIGSKKDPDSNDNDDEEDRDDGDGDGDDDDDEKENDYEANDNKEKEAPRKQQSPSKPDITPRKGPINKRTQVQNRGSQGNSITTSSTQNGDVKEKTRNNVNNNKKMNGAIIPTKPSPTPDNSGGPLLEPVDGVLGVGKLVLKKSQELSEESMFSPITKRDSPEKEASPSSNEKSFSKTNSEANERRHEISSPPIPTLQPGGSLFEARQSGQILKDDHTRWDDEYVHPKSQPVQDKEGNQPRKGPIMPRQRKGIKAPPSRPRTMNQYQNQNEHEDSSSQDDRRGQTRNNRKTINNREKNNNNNHNNNNNNNNGSSSSSSSHDNTHNNRNQQHSRSGHKQGASNYEYAKNRNDTSHRHGGFISNKGLVLVDGHLIGADPVSPRAQQKFAFSKNMKLILMRDPEGCLNNQALIIQRSFARFKVKKLVNYMIAPLKEMRIQQRNAANTIKRWYRRIKAQNKFRAVVVGEMRRLLSHAMFTLALFMMLFVAKIRIRRVRRQKLIQYILRKALERRSILLQRRKLERIHGHAHFRVKKPEKTDINSVPKGITAKLQRKAQIDAEHRMRLGALAPVFKGLSSAQKMATRFFKGVLQIDPHQANNEDDDVHHHVSRAVSRAKQVDFTAGLTHTHSAHAMSFNDIKAAHLRTKAVASFVAMKTKEKDKLVKTSTRNDSDSDGFDSEEEEEEKEIDY